MMLPDKAEIEVDYSLKYPDDPRSKPGRAQDDRLPVLKEWLSKELEKKMNMLWVTLLLMSV